MTNFLLYMIAQLLVIIARKDEMPVNNVYKESQRILNQIDKKWMEQK